MLPFVFSGGILLGVASLLVMMAIFGRSEEVEASIREEPKPEEMKPYLLWHSFYANPRDPRGWLPKSSGYGWTVNFRKKEKALFFVAGILLTLFSALGLVLSIFSLQ
jgi:uncharacterized membrane protein